MALFAESWRDGIAAFTGVRKSDAGILKDLADQDPTMRDLVGAAMAVHAELGPGFHARVYRAALAQEFTLAHIPHERDALVSVHYKGQTLDVGHTADFICFGDTLVKVLVMMHVGDDANHQFISDLRAMQLTRGLLLNFGKPQLDFRRAARAAGAGA